MHGGLFMSSERNGQLDVGTLFHSLLFAYQKAVRDALGSGCEAFVHPMLATLRKIDEKRGSKLLKCESLDEAFAALSGFMLKTGAVKGFSFRRKGKEFVLRVDGCAWASHIHEELKPKDVTCPYALIAMAIFEKYTGEKPEETESKYFADGTETEIKALDKGESCAVSSLEASVNEHEQHARSVSH
jgi:hypothetical protein